MFRLARGFAALSIAAATLAMGCAAPSGPGGVLDDTVELATQTVSDEVARYLFSGIDDRRRLYIKDVEAWKALWNEVTADVRPRPEAPFIDFSREAVVVVSMGALASGGSSIRVESVSESGAHGTLFVEVVEVSPGRNCVVTQAVTAPVHAVRVPLRNASVEFIERTETLTCQTSEPAR